MDYSNWMSANLSLLGSYSLRQISMPASHDAGMYALSGCTAGANSCNTQTQTNTILQQLQAGIRYFDIRPVIYSKTLYTGHYNLSLGAGCNGAALDDVLTDVLTFMGSSNDLAILKFSHYYDRDEHVAGFSDTQMDTLCAAVTSKLSSVLYNQSVSSGGLSDVTIDEYIGTSGKILAVFDQLSDTVKSQYTGVYSYADAPVSNTQGDLIVYDHYSDTNDLDTMTADQLAKLTDTANHQNNLFLLSWTLTQSTGQAIGCVSGLGTSILDLSEKANSVLWSELNGAYQHGSITLTCMPNLLYVDNCATFVTDVAMQLNQYLLKSS